MSHLNLPARLLRIFVVAALAVTAVSCADDDDGGGDATATTASGDGSVDTTEPEATPVAYDGYADHESELYGGTENWICHPDLADDVCADIDTTVVAADGSQEVVETEPASDPPIDCFYTYPTASTDQGMNADLEVDESETNTVRAQAAPFGTACRVFAPAYRQVPLANVMTRDPAARDMAYGDIVDAWKTYINEENDGRGVVIIGHSQGAGVLRRLVAEEIDTEPGLRDLLVSALLLGTSVAVPNGEDVGGDFDEVPACREPDDVGCVIAYVSYRADDPPTEESGAFFGRVSEEGQQALCVNPLELTDGETTSARLLVGSVALLGSTEEHPEVETPFVSLPGVATAECAESGPYSYLAWEPAGTTDDQRDVEGLLEQRLGLTWGLHLLDVHLPHDDLIEIVEQQGAAFGG